MILIKDIPFIVLVILDPVFIKQGGNITAKLGDLIAHRDGIRGSVVGAQIIQIVSYTFSHSTVQRRCLAASGEQGRELIEALNKIGLEYKLI